MNDQADQNLPNPKNAPQQPPANQVQGQQLPPARAGNDWSGVGGGRVVGAFITVAVIFVILMLLMKTCSTPTLPLSSTTAENPSGGDILQQRVDEAFSVGDEPDAATIPPAPAVQTAPAQQQQSMTPQQQQAQDAQQQQDLAIQREEELQRQRDAVPSLLPENPPAPANLGDY